MASSTRRDRWFAVVGAVIALAAIGVGAARSSAMHGEGAGVAGEDPRSGISAVPTEPTDSRIARSTLPPPAVPDSAEDLWAEQLLVERDFRRIWAAAGSAGSHPDPYVTDPRDAPYLPEILVLPRRADPYDLSSHELAATGALTRGADGAVTLNMPLLVSPGASLTIDSLRTPEVILRSDTTGYAAIVAVDATLVLSGTTAQPLTITAQDPATGTADEDRTDGRSYILGVGSQLSIRHARISHLGLLPGPTSGVAWWPSPTRAAGGGIHDSVLSSNYVGAYASGTDGLRIERASFTDNEVHGLDAYGSTNLAVTDSTAIGNGRHGFLLTTGSSAARIRDSASSGNGGSGFMIDDGDPASRTGTVATDRTVLAGVSSRGNGVSGITIEGGDGNSIQHALIDSNRYGIWLKNGTSGSTINDARVTASERTALRMTSGTRGTRGTGLSLSGQRVGVEIEDATATALDGMVIASSADTAIAVAGPLTTVDLNDVVVRGTGRHAVAMTDGAASTAVTGSPDLTDWQSPEPPPSPRFAVSLDVTTVAKAIPWLLILLPILVLWLPARLGRRR